MKQPQRAVDESFSPAAKKMRMQTYLASTRVEFALALQKARTLGHAAQGVLAGPVITLEKGDSSNRS
jgi:hypothetical protein